VLLRKPSKEPRSPRPRPLSTMCRSSIIYRDEQEDHA
jgi:hypothetical protein